MIALLIALQATTVCSQGLSGTIHCTTNQTPNFTYRQPPDYYGQIASGVERQQQAQEQQRRKIAAQTVGTMLAKGDCGGALRYALQSGDLDLAERVKLFCGN